MNSEYARALLRKFKGRHIILDSNLLILLLLGSFDIRLIRSFKRLSGFTLADFQIVRDLSQSYKIATSAHVLTEVSNLSNDLPQNLREKVFSYIAPRIVYLREEVIPAAQIAPQSAFYIFGLTDAVLASLCESHLLLTNDLKLAAHLRMKHHAVLTLQDLQASRSSRILQTS